jgi:hypothetical protein
MNNSIKSGLSLHRLIRDAPLERLLEFFRSSEYGNVDFEDHLLTAAVPDAELRNRLHATAADMEPGRQRRLEDEAARVLAVVSQGDWALSHAVRDEICASARVTFGQQKDPLGRSLWSLMNHPDQFANAESIHHAARYRGYVQQSPWVTIANKQLELMGRFMVELGITPASRSRVAVFDKASPEAMTYNFVTIYEDAPPAQPKRIGVEP